MNKKYLILGIILVMCYLVSIIFLSFQVSLSYESIKRAIITLLALISFTIFINTEKSNFIKIFSLVSLIFFGFDIFYSLFKSIIKNKDLLFYNTSFLSHTEGFIMFFCIAYLLYNWKNGGKK